MRGNAKKILNNCLNLDNWLIFVVAFETTLKIRLSL